MRTPHCESHILEAGLPSAPCAVLLNGPSALCSWSTFSLFSHPLAFLVYFGQHTLWATEGSVHSDFLWALQKPCTPAPDTRCAWPCRALAVRLWEHKKCNGSRIRTWDSNSSASANEKEKLLRLVSCLQQTAVIKWAVVSGPFKWLAFVANRGLPASSILWQDWFSEQLQGCQPDADRCKGDKSGESQQQSQGKWVAVVGECY